MASKVQGRGLGTAPKGNYVARNLKLMNDNSHGFFPATPAEAKREKFDTVYKKDYHEFDPQIFLDGAAPKGQQPKRETIRDVLFGESPTSMFANWRIPKRISGECEDARIGDHIGLNPPERIETPKILRQSTLPAISTTRAFAPTFTPKPRVTATDIRKSQNTPQVRRSQTSLDMASSRQESRNRMKSRVGQWKERLPEVDPRLLEKVLRLQDQENGSAHRTLQPDARRTVERWLEGASEPERQVALQFFGSMAGGRLMGGQGDPQRLKEVVEALKNPGDRFVAEAGLSPRGGIYTEAAGGDTGRKGLKYVNLLDDSTRQQRWMHTTWHHLPHYRHTDPVNNWSSHYIKPHQAPHRHFVIHPDWPPQH